MNLRTALYRGAFALRHPDAVSIWRRGVDYDQYKRLSQPWLKRLDIRTVLDIGGNVGQFARLIHAVLPEATIYSFEPLPDCHRHLSRALEGFDRFQAFNCAIGDTAGDLDFWKSPHTPASSFLPMTSAHEAAYPESRHSAVVRVHVRPLDDVSRELHLRDNLFIKIDVQGYEGRVIRGGEATLRRAVLALIETSFVPLYRDQMLFAEVLARMEALGLRFFGNLAQHNDPQTGCPLFADSLFINADWAHRLHG